MRHRSPDERTLWGAVLFELRKSPPLLAGITLGTVGYSAGHAGLAFGAGSLAAGLGAAPLTWAKGSLEPVLTAAYVGLAGAFVKGLGAVALASSERTVAARVAGALRVKALEELLECGASMPAPQALSALSVRLREIETAIIDGLLASARSMAQLVPLAVCLVLIAPVPAALALGITVPFALLVSRLRGRARRSVGRARTLAEELECGVDELVRNAELFRTYGAGGSVLDRVSSASREAGAALSRVESERAALSSMNEIIAVMAVLLVLSVRHDATALAGTALLPFAAIFFMGYRPLRDLGDARAFSQRGVLALAAVRSVAADSVRVGHGEVQVPSGPGLLELSDYGARERGPRTTLSVRPGEILAVIGPTGAGKTTLLRTLLGLEKPIGRVSFAGVDITFAPIGPTHRPFAWAPQGAPLVTGTLARNVMLTGANEAEARRALEALGATSLFGISETETVGPGGRPLSGGERRLVSIARALSSGLPVILLDEPTEGLDPISAHAVMQALSGLRSQRTLIVVTHREEVCRLADRVVCIGEGKELSAAAE